MSVSNCLEYPQNQISWCSNFNRKWYDLIIDSVFTQLFERNTWRVKNVPKYLVPIYFDKKGLELIHLNSILLDNSIIHHLPETSRGRNSIRNKIFNHQDTVNSVNINDTNTFGTGIKSCKCSTSAYLNHHHGHIITGNLWINTNSKLRNIIGKGLHYRKLRTISWKDNIIDGLDSLIKK